MDAKLLPRAEVYQPIMIVTLFLYASVILAYIIMRYGCLRRETVAIPWNAIQSVALQPKKNKMCIVYRAPNYRGDVKTFSMTMKFKKEVYTSLVDSVNAFAPGIPRTNKIRATHSPVVLVWLTALLIELTFVIGIALMKFLSSGH